MNYQTQDWSCVKDLKVLNSIQSGFSSTIHSPLFQTYLRAITQYCPKNGTTCEFESTNSYAAVWLSQQRYRATGLLGSPKLAERARQINDFLVGRAKFNSMENHEVVGDYDVIHHIDVLQEYKPDIIRDILNSQVNAAAFVVFIVAWADVQVPEPQTEDSLFPYHAWASLLAEYSPLFIQRSNETATEAHGRLICILRGKRRQAARSQVSTAAVRQSDAASTQNYEVSVRWEGAFLMHGSLAHVNREICRLLAADKRIDLSLVETHSADIDPTKDTRFTELSERFFNPLTRPADVLVRQGYPPRMTRALEGKFALMQPWDFGYLPQIWIEPIMQHVDEVWCNTNYVVDVFKNSGIPENRLQLVPLGFEPSIFHPGVPPPDIPGIEKILSLLKDKFVFLYVGGTVKRKGFPVLLEAYLKEFHRRDDVVLLVKDHGKKRVYPGHTSESKIFDAIEDASHPHIVYLDDEMSAEMLAGIFCMANCSVHPYRGEGFCLPALEALACGLPVAATAGGPTDDFVDDTVGWRLPAKHEVIAETIYSYESFVGPTWVFAVDPTELGHIMRGIYNNPAEAAQKGQRGAQRASSAWTWQHTANILIERMRIIRDAPPRIRGVASQWSKQS